MFNEMNECDCTLNFSEEGISGKPTKLEYQGNGTETERVRIGEGQA